MGMGMVHWSWTALGGAWHDLQKRSGSLVGDGVPGVRLIGPWRETRFAAEDDLLETGNGFEARFVLLSR